MGMGTNARMKLAAAGTLLLSLSSFAAHAATLTVSTLVDSGPGSLRDAITLAAAGDTYRLHQRITRDDSASQQLEPRQGADDSRQPRRHLGWQ